MSVLILNYVEFHNWQFKTVANSLQPYRVMDFGLRRPLSENNVNFLTIEQANMSKNSDSAHIRTEECHISHTLHTENIKAHTTNARK